MVAGAGALAEALAAVRARRPFRPEQHGRLRDDQLMDNLLLPREWKKVDRFSLLGLAALRSVLRDAPLPGEWLRQCGIFVGNMLGGWTFTEPEERRLPHDGPAAVSPYLATAWFPASLQGHATIGLGMRGIAKTVTTDRCSAGQAIGLAWDYLRRCGGMVFAGGAEAPLTGLVSSALQSRSPLAEGAAFLRLSAREQTPGASTIVMGGHLSFRIGPSPVATRLKGFITSIPRRLPLRFVVCNTIPHSWQEEELCQSVRSLVGSAPELCRPNRTVGDCLGASSAVAAVLAWQALVGLSGPGSALVASWGDQCAHFAWMYTGGGRDEI
jgi:hypothetical protein